MDSNGSLRRLLRRIPEFRSLTSRELDAVLQKMILKEYKAGQVLWRTEKLLNLLAVIERGEIVMEHRSHGVPTYTARRSTGDWVDLNRWNPRPGYRSIAWAQTDVRLYIIHREDSARKAWLDGKLTSWTWKSLWVVLIMAIVLSFGFADIRRILSDAFILVDGQGQIHFPGHERSIGLLGYAMDLDPRSSYAYNRQGYLLYQNGYLQEAADLFATAADIDPGSGSALNNMAVTYYKQGMVEQAVQLQEQAILQDPDNPHVRDNFGIMLIDLGRGREALRAFKEASFIQPDWALPVLHQALLLLQMKRYAEAEIAATKAIQLEPEQLVSHMVLVISLYEQGRDAEALTAVDAALVLSPEEEAAIFYKASILGRLGKTKEALLLLNQLQQSTKNPWDTSRVAREILFLEGQQISLTPAP